jgi:hypothetical protein
MKAWAEKRRREMEAGGATELARMFELVARLCELQEELQHLNKERDDSGW